MSLEYFQKQQQQKRLTHITRRDDKYIVMLINFHPNKNKKFWEKLTSIAERAMTFNELD